MSHASTNAQRLFTRASHTAEPKKKARLLRLAKQWDARAVETDSERAARIKDEDARFAQQASHAEAKRLLSLSRRIEAQARTERWAAIQAERYAGEAPEQREERLENETRRWKEHKDALAARSKKRKKKSSKVNAERWEERAERWRQREAVAEAKRAAKRLACAVAKLPPLPY